MYIYAFIEYVSHIIQFDVIDALQKMKCSCFLHCMKHSMKFHRLIFNHFQSSVSMTIEHDNFDISSLHINEIKIYGAPGGIKRVTYDALHISFDYEIDESREASIISILNLYASETVMFVYRWLSTTLL